jgi:hypothetical protein
MRMFLMANSHGPTFVSARDAIIAADQAITGRITV